MTINIDPLAHKATFNSTCAQLIIQLACVELIDLPLHIFEMICYKANIISTDNLPYGVIITKLLLDQVVQLHVEEWLIEQMSLLDMISHFWSIGQGRDVTTLPEKQVKSP